MNEPLSPPALVNGADAPVDFVAPDTKIDLTNCDREPIHIPGAIQPYGILLAMVLPSHEVVQVSRSIQGHLGLAPKDVLGLTLGEALGSEVARRISGLKSGERERDFTAVTIEHAETGEQLQYDAVVHMSGRLLILELEPRHSTRTMGREGFGTAMRAVVQRLEGADSLSDLANGVAEEMRSITGFDRVWVYRFHADWHGEIIGESKREGIETWLGMHYPASDIPAQARALFLRNWVRVIPDLSFEPSPLIPERNPLDAHPTDLGKSLLRSVSPIHVQYLQNMGVTASLVISLIHRGKLWGLISGHHYSGPKRVSSEIRSLCEVVAQALSLQIGTIDQLEERDYALVVRSAQSKLLSRISEEDEPREALVTGNVILRLVGATGAAVLREGEVDYVGAVPDHEDVDELAEWVRDRSDDLFSTSRLAAEFPPAEKYSEVASGLLALPLSRDRRDLVLWFRPEQKQMVRWAGDPRKPATVGADGSTRLHPRGSFEAWEQEVRGTSRSWRPIEIQAALDVRRALLDLLVRKAEETALLNAELERANVQLEETALELETQAEELLIQREEREALLLSERDLRQEAERANKAKADFLAVMSHELRTPLNAIGGYAELMALGTRGPITGEQASDLERIQVNQRHLLGLINSILNFTKLEAGEVEVTTEPVRLAEILDDLHAMISTQMKERRIALVFDEVGPDTAVEASPEKLRQILLNLLTNALKFTPAGGEVVVKTLCRDEWVEVTVTDTGRGIPADRLENIFEPFIQVDRHITASEDQGVGLGLAISRELARAMGGDLKVRSEVGEGSTFTLSLARAEIPA